ncbi:NlpC/P60 family protein [Flavobacterium sp. CBA20B-1]|uniref:C40 family peptidase n=1 Tax=unclassified Flavobacterium TaxID=196869 RepID=UPI002224A2FF|nr:MULTISPECIES: NlpC/P60 family protein [unclassified Flavobacterium]WCM42633.1 NlpC/P60 family protein [Flavobacterium sp. CBA20B-1]
MMNNIQNRSIPVFFISKYILICFLTMAAFSCKSKTDWRDKYNQEKNNKKEVVKTNKTVSKPASLEEISTLLDVSTSSLKNKSLYQFIIDWYGTPYQFGGISKRGVDCSGFTNLLYKEVYNLQLPRVSKDIAANVKRKYTKDLKEGDLVFFSFGNTGVVNHVGIYLQNNMFVHASTSKGVIISNLTAPYYGNFLIKCGSYQQYD